MSDSDMPHDFDLDARRQFFAEELRAVANLQSEALVRAFAKVPREHFLGPGPWQIRIPSGGYRTTPDADPKHLYHNVLVAIDAGRHLNNGQPSGLALWFDALDLQEGNRVVHVGCGTGYYSAILAEVVGSNGQVIAIDVDPELASRARSNLSYLGHVHVLAGDGGEMDLGPSDAIFINAGATHPRAIWLDALRPGGRLLVPLTVTKNSEEGGGGLVLKVTRQPAGFTARFISEVGIFSCSGGRDPKLNQQLTVFRNQKNINQVHPIMPHTHGATRIVVVKGVPPSRKALMPKSPRDLLEEIYPQACLSLGLSHTPELRGVTNSSCTVGVLTAVRIE